jgi:phenylacetate-CoA ligase
LVIQFMTSVDHLDRPALVEQQLIRLRELLREIIPSNRFYAQKLAAAGITPDDIRTPADFSRIPFTKKAELIADQQAHPPYGQILTYPVSRYVRLCQTSGTTRQPLRWLDTPESWNWLLSCWETIYRMVGVRSGDRLFFAFSFGPFLGFWTAFDSASRLGYLCLPGGGMSSAARLRFMLDNQATVVLCTPTYALRLTEVASQQGIDLKSGSVRLLIVAGEPGGSIPATRARIESAWGARLFDHNGLTEVGPVGVECTENPAGIHILETHYIGEVIDPETTRPVPSGTLGELVLTNLGRSGSPVLRYRTGDLVKVDPEPCPCGSSFMRLQGGVLGRTDDMIHIRGNNLYPSALEAIIHRFPEVAEFRVEIDESESLTALRIELEPASDSLATGLADRVAQSIREELLFRADVRAVAPGSLPRYEMKAQRFHKKTLG